MSFYISVILATLYRASPAAAAIDVCTSEFTGSSGQLCEEYGFCSSCVSNGCSWCELTSRCESVHSACTKHELFGLMSVENCTNEYINNNRERPDIFTTGYDAELSAIMSTYAEFAKGNEDITQYPTFSLEQDSVQTFTADVTTIEGDQCQAASAIAEISGLALDVLGLNSLQELAVEMYEILYLGDPNNRIPLWSNLGLSLGDILSTALIAVETANSLGFTDIYTEKLEDLTNVLDFDNLGTSQVAVGLDHVNNAIVVSFSGADDVTSVLLSNCLINWDKSDIAQLKSDLGLSSNVYVTEIISAAYDALKDEFYSSVQQFIQDYPEYNLFITGHALGGALANIFVLDLYADYYNNAEALDATKLKVYTYGQPRVGNDGFATLVNTLLDYEYYRVVLGKDPIAVIPSWSFGFRHNGIEIHYGVGDFAADTLCQYRECTILDPYEDTSCRFRYNDVDWHDALAPVQELLNLFGDLTLANFENFFDSAPNRTNYANLGTEGHCGAYDTSVKCTDRSAFLSVDVDDYRCVTPGGRYGTIAYNLIDIVSDIAHTVTGWDFLDAFDATNGCPDDMSCCLGTLRSGSTCVERGDYEAYCPKTNIDEQCLEDDDCQDTYHIDVGWSSIGKGINAISDLVNGDNVNWESLLTEGFGSVDRVECEEGICEEEGAGLGESCSWSKDCKGYSSVASIHSSGVSCCANSWKSALFNIKKGTCQEKQEDYLGLYWCPWQCVKKWGSGFGSCSYEYDGTCDTFTDNVNDECSDTADNWNLGIVLGDHEYSNTDARVMFSYCINRECSDWYFLNHCGFDDFEGSCSFQYYVVPNLAEDMEAALHSSNTSAIDFEFATCDGAKSADDGVLIDQISIGHDASLLVIDTFVQGDDAFCRFSGIDEGAFSVDTDTCGTVSVSYHLGSTSATIYSGLISELSREGICATNPGCTTEAKNCEVQGIGLVTDVPTAEPTAKPTPSPIFWGTGSTICDSFKVNENKVCSATANGWNLALATGDSENAATDSRIMFSYCIDGSDGCSDWYFLNHDDFDDFEGSCTYQYYIVPNLAEDIEAALDSSKTTSIHFEFATCGSNKKDGLQIDRIGVGHGGTLLTIDEFLDPTDLIESCRFRSANTDSFALDYDSNDGCSILSIEYDFGTDSSTVYNKDNLQSKYSRLEICQDRYTPAQATPDDCEVHGRGYNSAVSIVNNPDIYVVEISGRMLFILAAFMVILLFISMNNVSRCRRNKVVKYHSVNVESSSEDC